MFASRVRMDVSLPQCDGQEYVCRGCSDEWLVLDHSASTEDDAYTGMKLRIVAGPGKGNEQIVLSYLGRDQKAFVSGWVATPTSNVTRYVLEPYDSKSGAKYGFLSRLNGGWLAQKHAKSALEAQQLRVSTTAQGKRISLGHVPHTRGSFQDAVDAAAGISVHGREVQAGDLFAISLAQDGPLERVPEYQQRVDKHAAITHRRIQQHPSDENFMGARHQVDALTGAVISTAPALRVNLSRSRQRPAMTPAALALVPLPQSFESADCASQRASSLQNQAAGDNSLTPRSAALLIGRRQNVEESEVEKRAAVEANLLASLAQVGDWGLGDCLTLLCAACVCTDMCCLAVCENCAGTVDS